MYDMEDVNSKSESLRRESEYDEYEKNKKRFKKGFPLIYPSILESHCLCGYLLSVVSLSLSVCLSVLSGESCLVFNLIV